nr:NfeD family protein [Zoogloeaceae bacterium]
MNPEWWHWAVGGIALVLLELAIPSFFVIWFGIGAVLVALAMLVVADLSIVAQLGVWIVASVAMT